MRVILEGREADIDNLAVLQSRLANVWISETPGGSHLTEQVANVLFISCRWKVGHKHRRTRSKLNLNRMLIYDLLITRLRDNGLIFGIELDDGCLGLAVITGQQFSTIYRTTL